MHPQGVASFHAKSSIRCHNSGHVNSKIHSSCHLEEHLVRDKVFMDPGTLRRAHSTFLDNGRIPGGLLPKTIERSWTRCAELGLPADRIRDLNRLSEADIAREHDRASSLISHFTPVMDHLYQQIAHTNSMVILSDEDGLILHSIGDPDFISKAESVALQPGVSWAETLKGTNAIGTAIIEKAEERKDLSTVGGWIGSLTLLR